MLRSARELGRSESRYCRCGSPGSFLLRYAARTLRAVVPGPAADDAVRCTFRPASGHHARARTSAGSSGRRRSCSRRQGFASACTVSASALGIGGLQAAIVGSAVAPRKFCTGCEVRRSGADGGATAAAAGQDAETAEAQPVAAAADLRQAASLVRRRDIAEPIARAASQRSAGSSAIVGPANQVVHVADETLDPAVLGAADGGPRRQGRNWRNAGRSSVPIGRPAAGAIVVCADDPRSISASGAWIVERRGEQGRAGPCGRYWRSRLRMSSLGEPSMASRHVRQRAAPPPACPCRGGRHRCRPSAYGQHGDLGHDGVMDHAITKAGSVDLPGLGVADTERAHFAGRPARGQDFRAQFFQFTFEIGAKGFDFGPAVLAARREVECAGEIFRNRRFVEAGFA